MKNGDDRAFLADMLDAVHQIEIYAQTLSFQQFLDDRLRQDGVIRQIQIIGEAARRLSSEFLQEHRAMPWSQIIGMRHKVIHDYFEVDWETVWETATIDLPFLGEWLEKTLDAM